MKRTACGAKSRSKVATGAVMESLRQDEQESISIEDEVRERSTITPQEMAEISADVYGLTTSFEACRLSHDGTLSGGLRALDAELARIPPVCKSSFLEALRINPALVDDAHRKLFLRANDMDAKRAAEKLVKYWHNRHELFGSEKFHLPLTLDGALRDDKAAWSQEFCHLLPTKDKFGRAILFLNPSRVDGSKYSLDSLMRMIWYIHHVALDDPEVQRCGMVIVTREKQTRSHSLQFALVGGLVRHTSELHHCFPLKIRAAHMCHPNWLAFMVLPSMKFFIGKRMRLRLLLHGGSDTKVLEELSYFGLTPDLLPIHLGGDVALNAEKWIQCRIGIETSAPSSQICLKEEESKHDDLKTPGAKLSSDSTDVPKGERVGHRNDGDTATQGEKKLHHNTMIMEAAAASFESDVHSGVENETIAEPAAKAISHLTGRKHKKVGRGGDPRMDKAIKAKQANPKLSLLDALVVWGFTFPNHGEYTTDKGLFGEDGVSLYQRKNQLNRRLRIMRQKMQRTNAKHKRSTNK